MTCNYKKQIDWEKNQRKKNNHGTNKQTGKIDYKEMLKLL